MAGKAKDRGIREKRPGVYELRVSLGRNPATGEYESKSEIFEGSLPDARKARGRLLARVGGPGMRAGLGDLTIDEAIAAYLEMVTSPELGKFTRKTQESYRQRLGYLSTAYGNLGLKVLSTERLNDLYLALAKRTDANTVLSVHQTINTMLNWCRMPPRRWIDVNPAEHTERPKAKVGHITFPTVDQLRSIIARAEESKNPDNASLFRFTADTGLRLGEVAALRWENVDLDRGRVLVMASMDKTFEKDTKTHKSRTVRLSANTVTVLRDHRIAMEKRAAEFGVFLHPRARVWSMAPDGSEARSPSSVSENFKDNARAVGYGGSFHTLRHFMITQWLNAGRPVFEVANRAGHSVKIMLTTYAHWIDGADQVGADQMGGLLDG